MATYHFLKNFGEVLECLAPSTKNCGVAASDEHFTSFEAAEFALKTEQRNERNKLDPALLGHGDRISIRNPHNGFLLDSVVNDTGYSFLIQTTGAGAPTNDVKRLISEGWVLESRVGAYGEMTEDPGKTEVRAKNRADELFRELRIIENKRDELEDGLAKDPSNAMMRRHVESFRNQAKHLAEQHREAQETYANAVLFAVGGDRPAHFNGLQDIPYGFRGIGGPFPRYLHKGTGDEITELPEGYDYISFSGDNKWFESFGEAVEWARSRDTRQENS